MSAQQIAPVPEHVCYVHCNFCNTILAVSVPSHSMLNIVTVRCGHCTSLLSVNLRGLLQSLPVQNHYSQENNFKVQNFSFTENYPEYAPSSSKYRMPTMLSAKGDLDHMLHVRDHAHAMSGCKFYRKPFFGELKTCMKNPKRIDSPEEIRRIKASNPDISHREAFSTAAKNWAHFPNIHFGLGPYESSNKLDEAIGATGHPQKVQDLY